AAPAAPPPYYDEDPGYAPYDSAIWIHGYWRWRGEWIWIRGRWSRPPMFGYEWCEPYYEARPGVVVIVEGHWRRHGVVFVAPPPAPGTVRPGTTPVRPQPGIGNQPVRPTPAPAPQPYHPAPSPGVGAQPYHPTPSPAPQPYHPTPSPAPQPYHPAPQP